MTPAITMRQRPAITPATTQSISKLSLLSSGWSTGESVLIEGSEDVSDETLLDVLLLVIEFEEVLGVAGFDVDELLEPDGLYLW